MYGGYGVNVFGIISISGFKIPNTELADRLIDWHTDIVWPMLLVFVAAHIIGALYHQFILKDHIFITHALKIPPLFGGIFMIGKWVKYHTQTWR